jgi:hypothetical protein
VVVDDEAETQVVRRSVWADDECVPLYKQGAVGVLRVASDAAS